VPLDEEDHTGLDELLVIAAKQKAEAAQQRRNRSIESPRKRNAGGKTPPLWCLAWVSYSAWFLIVLDFGTDDS
jgi:hypothetical protein